MNRREIDAMRQRLKDRAAAEGEDPPALLAVAGVLFVALIVVINFI